MDNKDIEHLKWVYERMQYVHKERIDSDYMLKFKEILKRIVNEKRKSKK